MSDDTKRKIEVMQAFLAGEEIEFATAGDDDWETTRDFIITWDWNGLDYRVKPKPREFWVNVYEGISCAIHQTEDRAVHHRGKSCIKTIHVREVMDGDS